MTRTVCRGVTVVVALSVSVLAASVSVQAGAADLPPLIEAVKQGDAAKVRALIDRGWMSARLRKMARPRCIGRRTLVTPRLRPS